jgi:hypothetical protein
MADIQPLNGKTGAVSDIRQFVLTDHAIERMAQRNLTISDVQFTMKHGQRVYRTGVVFIFLGRRDMPDDKIKQFGRLEGTTVLLNPKTREVVTVYRNRNGLRKIKRKACNSLKEVNCAGHQLV